MISETAPPRRFEFGRDTFAYANELVWDYEAGADARTMIARRSSAPRTYTHRCFVMVRAARQFFHHARFDASLPPVADAEYGRLIRAVMASDPRATAREIPAGGRIVIPGYESLHRFSEARAALLMAHCGGIWQSYVLRSHWRMILPVSPRHQANMVAQLTRSLEQRGAAIVHLFRFPQLTINHGILLYAQTPTATGVKFSAYDPNQPVRPTEMTYEAAEYAFHFPRNFYWAGGPVSIVETYCSWLY